MKINSIVSWLIAIGLVIVLLVYGQHIILPFVIALLIWFVVKKIRNLIDKVTFVHKHIPKWLKTGLASFIVFSILVFVAQVFSSNIENLSESYQIYASNIDLLSTKLNQGE